MKYFASLAFAIATISAPLSIACQPGDTSKILLIVADSESGQENEVIGEISTGNGRVITRSVHYQLVQKNKNQAVFERFTGTQYLFQYANSTAYKSFCYKVILGEK